MANPKTNQDHAKEAAKALINLNTFAAVVTVLEGGHVYGNSNAAERIIKICQAEQQRFLDAYDQALARLTP
ncbi:MAG: hypothetical protein RIB80_04880 [Rhodospirillales bacterium]